MILVRRIMECIDKLKRTQLSDEVKDLLISLERDLSHLLDDVALNPYYLEKFKEIFRKRWEQIFDTSEDYTYNPRTPSNQEWINLAVILAPEMKLTPRQLLIPIPDEHDPFLFQLIKQNNKQYEISLVVVNESETGFIHLKSMLEQIKQNRPIKATYLDETLKNNPSIIKKKRPLAVYRDSNPFDMRALSLRELLRIKLKKEKNFVIHDGNTLYKNFWDYCLRSVIPLWSTEGVRPSFIFPALLDLLSDYYREPATFREQVIVWGGLLENCHVDDVYHLYGQLICVGDHEKYLIDILLDFLQSDKPLIELGINALIKWLILNDASMVSSCRAFSPVYKNLRLGSAFRLPELKEWLLALKLNCPSELNQAITHLVTLSNEKAHLDPLIIDKLFQVYKQRWALIKSTPLDYRICQDGTNAQWIRLAQILAGSGYLDMSYSVFLMHDSTHFSLETMEKIRLTFGSTYFVFLGKTYDRALHHLGQQVLMSPLLRGEIPREVLPLLVEVIHDYFIQLTQAQMSLSDGVQQFRQRLRHWVNDLYGLASDDVNCLLVEKISVDGQSYYFRDCLLYLLHCDASCIEKHLMALSVWLCEYDASFVIQHEAFHLLYKELHVGVGFCLDDLRMRLTKLWIDDFAELKSLFLLISHKSSIDQEIIKALTEMYARRWLKIKGSENDYTRKQDGRNRPWIRLAQLLSGGGHLTSNYYRLLMPTLRDEIDSVTRNAITDYPLNHYILPEKSSDYMVLLTNSVKDYYLSDELLPLFYDCNHHPKRPLTLDEHELLLSSSKKFHKFVQLTTYVHENDQSIRLSTLDAITRLVDKSLYPEGLVFMGRYDDEQYTEAEKAYLIFYQFYDKLAPEERLRLDRHFIFYGGDSKRFKDLIRSVKKDHCIALIGRFMVQFILDYLPNRCFNSAIVGGVRVDILGASILTKIDVVEMKKNSRHKTFSDAHEFYERAERLLLSLMCRKARPLPDENQRVHILDCYALLTTIEKQMFDSLFSLVKLGCPEQYPDFTHLIIRPLLSDNEPRTPTQRWLESIFDGSIFKELPHLYDVKCLMRLMISLGQEMDLPFANELLRTALQPVSEYSRLNNLRVNILFQKFLHTLPKQRANEMLIRLTSQKAAPDDRLFISDCIDLLLYHLDKVNFFARAQTEMFIQKPVFIRERLRSLLMEANGLHGVMRQFGLIANQHTSFSIKTQLTQEIKKIQDPIPAESIYESVTRKVMGYF